MKKKLRKIKKTITAIILLSGSLNLNAQLITPDQWLQQQTKPVFKPGHTLQMLGQLHCGVVASFPSTDTRTELAFNWGYTVPLSRPTGESVLINLCNSNPAKYKASAIISNQGNLTGCTTCGFPPSAFCRKTDGTLVNGQQMFSPEMPDSAKMETVESDVKTSENGRKWGSRK